LVINFLEIALAFWPSFLNDFLKEISRIWTVLQFFNTV